MIHADNLHLRKHLTSSFYAKNPETRPILFQLGRLFSKNLKSVDPHDATVFSEESPVAYVVYSGFVLVFVVSTAGLWKVLSTARSSFLYGF